MQKFVFFLLRENYKLFCSGQTYKDCTQTDPQNTGGDLYSSLYQQSAGSDCFLQQINAGVLKRFDIWSRAAGRRLFSAAAQSAETDDKLMFSSKALRSILVLWPGGLQSSWSVNCSDGVPTVYFMLHWHNLMCDTLSESSSHQTCYPTYLFTQKRRASRPLLGHSPVADHKLGPRLTSRAKTNRIQHFLEAQCYSITFDDSCLRPW